MVADVGRARWWWVSYGVLSVIAGLVAISWPDATLAFLAILFGVQLFILGIVRIVAALAIPDTSAAFKVLSVVLGILSLVFGVLCLRASVQTVVALTLVLGVFWLIHGVTDIIDGIGGRDRPGRAWTIVSGVVGVVGGDRRAVLAGGQCRDLRLAPGVPPAGAGRDRDHRGVRTASHRRDRTVLARASGPGRSEAGDRLSRRTSRTRRIALCAPC